MMHVAMHFLFKTIGKIIKDPKTKQKIDLAVDKLLDPIEDHAKEIGGTKGKALDLACQGVRMAGNFPDFPD